MDLDEFAEEGKKVVDFVADYVDSLRQRSVEPSVSPGYLKLVLPSTPPQKGASLDEILEEVNKSIFPGLSNSQHPGYHGFPPLCSSYPATLGGMLADVLGNVHFDWDISPAGSELDIITTNWYGKLIGLPECFLQGGQSRGSGVLMQSTNECIFVAMVTARRNMLRKLLMRNPSLSTAVLVSSLVAYCSVDSHCWTQRAGLVTLVNVRVLEVGEDHRLRARTLEAAVKEDQSDGLIPFFVNATLGSELCGSCDLVNEIGTVCKKYGLWLHVDASYAGNAFMCPEFRHHLHGIEFASSVNSNPASWLPVPSDCTAMFVKDRYRLVQAVHADRTLHGYSFTEMDWGYPSKTEFRALEFWFVMRSYGVEHLQRHIRNHVRLAEIFENHVRDDDRFEVICRNFGIVCFRLKGSNEMNRMLKNKVNDTGEIFVTPTCHASKYIIRFLICTERANEGDITHAWDIIRFQADALLKNGTNQVDP